MTDGFSIVGIENVGFTFLSCIDCENNAGSFAKLNGEPHISSSCASLPADSLRLVLE